MGCVFIIHDPRSTNHDPRFMNGFDLFGHVAFALIALSLMVRDMFKLRILFVAASLCLILYNYTALETPQWVLVQWSAAFIIINLYRLGLLVKEQINTSFSCEEQELLETQFINFAPTDFKKLLQAGTWREVNTNDILAKEGKPISYLMLIYCGKADVAANEKIVTQLKEGDFIGEMTFESELPATATVVASEPMRLLVWNKTKLRELLMTNPSIKYAMQSVLSSNLVEKLSRKN